MLMAQPLQVNRDINGDQVTLSYSFQDLEQTPQTLIVALPRQDLIRTPVVFRPLSPHRLLREVASIQRSYAEQQGWRDAKLTVANEQITYELLRGDAANRAERMRSWQRAEADAYSTVFQRHYYRHLRLHSGRRGYTPDHPRIAAESQYILRPLSDTLEQVLADTYGSYSPRDALAYLTHFIQQIPYDDFSDRLASPGAGYVTPGRLLYENRGDCDSKVTLLAALMANLFPDIERRIVYLPGHAMFALDIEPDDNDIFVRDGEMEFVVADPTGPAQLKVGEAGRAYQSHLRSGALTILPI